MTGPAHDEGRVPSGAGPPAETSAANDTEAALFSRARDWLYNQGEPRWIAEAFGHWVSAEVGQHEVPESWSALMSRWHHEPGARVYRARHGARVCGAVPWVPGNPLPPPHPDPPTSPDGDPPPRGSSRS